MFSSREDDPARSAGKRGLSFHLLPMVYKFSYMYLNTSLFSRVSSFLLALHEMILCRSSREMLKDKSSILFCCLFFIQKMFASCNFCDFARVFFHDPQKNSSGREKSSRRNFSPQKLTPWRGTIYSKRLIRSLIEPNSWGVYQVAL